MIHFQTAEGLISSTVTCPTADVSGTSSDDFYKLVDEVRAATASAEKVLEDRTTASPLLLRAREQLKRQEPVLSKLSEIASVKAQTGDPYGVDVVSSLAKEFSGVQYAIDDRVNKLVSEVGTYNDFPLTGFAWWCEVVSCEICCDVRSISTLRFHIPSFLPRIRSLKSLEEQRAPRLQTRLLKNGKIEALLKCERE